MKYKENTGLIVYIDTMASDGSYDPYAKRNIYDLCFNKIGRVNSDDKYLKKPDRLVKMIEYTEILLKLFPHCRVDFYYIKGNTYYEKITFYSGGGTQKITPVRWNLQIGQWIVIKR